MSIDAELYREANELLRQWNLAERVDRAYQAGSRSPLECWKAYIAWWEFLANNFPTPSEMQHIKRLKEWDLYYARIQRFEAWRKRDDK